MREPVNSSKGTAFPSVSESLGSSGFEIKFRNSTLRNMSFAENKRSHSQIARLLFKNSMAEAFQINRNMTSNAAQSAAGRGPTIELYATGGVPPNQSKLFGQSFKKAATQISSSLLSQSGQGKGSKSNQTNIDEKIPPIDRPIVGYWMLFCASMVFGIIVWGGLTRLTESGLSIVEWAPVRGAKLPTSEEEWELEFEKYKQFPEYKRIHVGLSLDDFKRIYFMEWFHRNIGRLIGLVFGLPAIYFIRKGYISRGNIGKTVGLGVLLLGQGAMGWYMVSSGLKKELEEVPHAVPRVSHYRLAAHLGLAYLFFAGLCLHGWSTLRMNRLVKGKIKNAEAINKLLLDPSVRSFNRKVIAATCLVLLTSLSGAFVAGLDAGLIYNTFPHMGDNIVPPTSELWHPLFSRDLAGNPQSMWFNIIENPTTVQLNHRVLAISTFFIISALWWKSRSLKLNPASRRLCHALMAAVSMQVGLGIATLVDLVPISLASAHQANSVGLLTAALGLIHALRPLPRMVVPI
ncbi:Cytochrome c oxidase assembly protein cox15 [Mycoemilia scoparia]|uniref:Cytochrome c oxidase assembly protein cox15 n=1 Tax=Mycoemilia scoparia TaxID=417184 RepID=A0A9W8A4Y9_9FUNG|nr:Cytochrome c oxidase assembly protein cox15 [Mycoemilia scoparia]